VSRLPFTSATIYLVIGSLLGPLALNLFTVDPLHGAKVLANAGVYPGRGEHVERIVSDALNKHAELPPAGKCSLRRRFEQ
jgi:hypothetical protein